MKAQDARGLQRGRLPPRASLPPAPASAPRAPATGAQPKISSTKQSMWAILPGNAGWCRGLAALPAMLVFQTRALDLSTTDMWGFPGGLSGKESACQCRRRNFDPWVRKIPWRKKCQPPPVFLPGESHGGRSLVGYSPWGCRRAGHD